MRRFQAKEVILLAFVLAAGFAVVFYLSNFLVGAKPKLPEGYEDEDLALQGEKLKGYSLGMEGLVADWYWMRSLQYIGDKFAKSELEMISLDDLKPLNPRLLYPLLDNATTLDPQFIAVYAYGATVLPAIDSGEAIAIAEKGIENNPSEWRLYQYLGFIHWRLKNYSRAAEVYEKGSRIEGAPPFMGLMAAKMQNDGGSRGTARQIYRQIHDQAQDSQTRENARLRLLQLDFYDERDLINEALAEFRSKTSHCPSDWRELLPLLRDARLPGGKALRFDKQGNLVDPSDAPYLMAEQGGRCVVDLDKEKTRLPLK